MRTKHRVFLFLFAALLATSSIAVLEASRGYSSELTFFEDSSRTIIVGEGYIDCAWRLTMFWGTITDEYDSFDTGCGLGGHPRFCGYTGCPSGEVCTTSGCQPSS